MIAPTVERWRRACQTAQDTLQAQRGDRPYWLGRLSDSALAAATAVSALSVADRDSHRRPIDAGLGWLADHRNDDGGWGDSPDSPSNPSCTALVLAAMRLAGADDDSLGRAYLDSTGGMAAIEGRYGADRTFSVPILTNAALAGMVDWSDVPTLPLELAALPRWTFRLGPMPVVSYALPALIAIGLLGSVKRPSRNPLTRLLRHAVTGRVLRRLEAIQPTSGGFLEATPLTSFVAMSLIAAGRQDCRAAGRAIDFLLGAQRDNGAWAIDENLSIWNTTLAVTALGTGDAATRDWLLARRQQSRHRYTHAAAGGWGWSHLPGSVPDADDTAGALLALACLPDPASSTAAASDGVRWLLGLQNRDGGWPTFCRGWGKLEFDRSGADLTAHVLRAIRTWRNAADGRLGRHMDAATERGLAHLTRSQRPDGAWLPLWFGSQHTPDQTNPVFGSARVLAAYRDLGLTDSDPARRGRDFLASAANPDGGFGAAAGAPSAVEETAAAIEALCGSDAEADRRLRTAAADWLADAVERGQLDHPSPIGLYFARLWYSEQLYPITMAAAALRRVSDDP